MNRILILFTLVVLCVSPLAFAQQVIEEPRPRYGIFGHVGINIHSADFRTLPGIASCCQQYTSGTGFGWDLGLLYELPFSSQWWLGLRAGYSAEGATLRSLEGTTVILTKDTIINTGTGLDTITTTTLMPGEFEHSIAASIGTIGIEPMISFRPAPALALYLGGRIGAIIQHTYEQKETLMKPEERGTFENLRRERNVSAGDIPTVASIEGAVVIGAGMEFPLNARKTVLLAPEIFGSFGVTNLLADSSWRTNMIRVGAALKFAPEPAPPVPPVPPVPPEPEREVPLLVSRVSAVGVESDGSEQDVFRLRVEEFVSVSLRPLLNYVFFEPNSSTIPDRYIRMSPSQAASFNVTSLHDVPTLPTYYQLLNVVGRRMKDNPDATIRLVGCNADLEEEKGNTDLSNQRAVAVRDYLRDVWGIPENRMKVEARNLPEKPSNPAETDGVEENRRVEIYANNPSIVEPIITNDTIRTANPPVIKFRPDVTSEAGVTGWKLSASQEGRPLKDFRGTGSVPSEIVWEVNRDQETMPRVPTPIDFTLEVADNAGQTNRSPQGQLPVEQVTISRKRQERVADKEIDRYSLILFDFDKADLNDANTRIGSVVKDRIKSGARVEVIGSTDRTGEADYNMKLSEERARNVARLLGGTSEARGIGESDLYNNNLPEGRFYCRTVSIVVETPVQ